MNLDLSFFGGQFLSPRERPAVNVFELSGFPRWETVASRVWAYFFDPSERHGLGTLFVDRLLALLVGALPVGQSTAVAFNPERLLGSVGWKVATEQSTDDRKRVDILLTNEELGLAIAIENKLDAAVANPFESYVRHAIERFPTAVVVLLAPSHRVLQDGDARWVSAALTYDELFDAVQGADLATMEPRSRGLFEQFRENTSERLKTMRSDDEVAIFEQFSNAVNGREQQILDFYSALEVVNGVLHSRGQRLHDLILEAMAERSLTPYESFLVNAGAKQWGRREGLVALEYVGFRFEGGPGVELMIGVFPRHRLNGLSVKAYANPRDPNRCMPQFDHIPLGLPFSATDDVVVQAFLDVVAAAQDALRAGR